MSVAPDLAGFLNAQERLRGQLGIQVGFYGEPVDTWPAGVQLDPETGRPYDPTIQPLTTVSASGTAMCTIFRRVGGGRASSGADVPKESPAGIGDANHIQIIGSMSDRALMQSASTAVINEREFKITGCDIDEPLRGAQRVIVSARVRRNV